MVPLCSPKSIMVNCPGNNALEDARCLRRLPILTINKAVCVCVSYVLRDIALALTDKMRHYGFSSSLLYSTKAATTISLTQCF